VELSCDLRVRESSGHELRDPRLSGVSARSTLLRAACRSGTARHEYWDPELCAERLEHGERFLERLLCRGLALGAPFERTLLQQRAAVLERPVTPSVRSERRSIAPIAATRSPCAASSNPSPRAASTCPASASQASARERNSAKTCSAPCGRSPSSTRTICPPPDTQLASEFVERVSVAPKHALSLAIGQPIEQHRDPVTVLVRIVGGI
jgi:hypothetical protein